MSRAAGVSRVGARRAGGASDRSLVAFTLLGQTAAGMVWGLAVVQWAVGPVAGPGGSGSGDWLAGPLTAAVTLLLAAGIAAMLHLGSPSSARRALSNLASSWLSREILLALVLTGVVGLVALLYATGVGPAGLRAVLLAGAAATGLALVYAMARVYQLRTVPGWRSPLTTTAFFLTAVVVGGLAAAVAVALSRTGLPPGAWTPSIRLLALGSAAGAGLALALEPLARSHARRARRLVDPGLWPRPRTGRWATAGRPALLAVTLLAGLGAAFMATVGRGSIGMATVPFLLAIALAAAIPAEVIGRAGFYVRRSRIGM